MAEKRLAIVLSFLRSRDEPSPASLLSPLLLRRGNRPVPWCRRAGALGGDSMTATSHPMSVPRSDPTSRIAIARSESEARLTVTLLDHALWRFDERKTQGRAAVLAVMERCGAAG